LKGLLLSTKEDMKDTMYSRLPNRKEKSGEKLDGHLFYASSEILSV
jgi:hypothetical protein